MPIADPLEPIAAIARSVEVLLVLVGWGIAEAVLLPIVPDVLIGILVLAAPDRAPILLGAAAAGGIAGALLDWWLVRRRPVLVARVLAAQPALGPAGIEAATHRLRELGRVRGFAQVGPGLPLKAYLRALDDVAPASTGGEVAMLALVNRLVRLGPVTIGFALLNPVETAVRRPAWLVAALYVIGWSLFYPVYWLSRDPARSR
jgi:membrane protein YqaA with SNARE-associated domain